MNWKQIATATVAATMVAGLATEAEAGRLQRVRRAAGVSTNVEAVAALSAVGGAAGWGRVKVQDSSRSGVTKREVDVQLYDLDPAAELTIEVDGVALGTVRTDGAGWASLKLESPDDNHPPVPAGLPAVTDLVSAAVFDASGAFVLVGDFSAMDTSGAGSLHEEKISLTDPSGFASGIAKVERSESGKQEFDTRATGLTAGDSFTVQVDGFVAGMVTADVVGQVRLSLEAPDDENPLPPELQPVEDLRLVEWLDTAGTVVLTGSFTGVSNNDDGEDEGAESFEGEITALAVDGFTLQSGMMTLTVVVTADTVYEDVAGLADLMVGDMVEAEGTLADTTLTAMRVELKNVDTGGGEDESGETSVEGTVTAVGADSVTLDTSDGQLTAVVTADTEFRHFSDLSELQAGDFVEVKGTWTGGSFIADRIELNP